MEFGWTYGPGKGYNGETMECLCLYRGVMALGKFVFMRDRHNQIDLNTLFAVVFVPAELRNFYEHLNDPEGPRQDDKKLLLEVKDKWDIFDIRNPGEVWYHPMNPWHKVGTWLKSLLGFRH